MDEYTIIALPKVNLELPQPNLEISSLKLYLHAQACHNNLKTIERQKISRQCYELSVNSRQKRKNKLLNEYLQAKRSYSTRENREISSTKKQVLIKVEGSKAVNKQKLTEQRRKSDMKIKKQLKSQNNVKVHKGTLFTKLFKKILPLQQRLNRYHYLSSLPIIVTILGKQPHQSPPPRFLEEGQLVRRRFLSQRKSFAGIAQGIKMEKKLKKTFKDQKIEGWSLKESKYVSEAYQNL